MEWYNYLACFFSGVFLANVVPHFVQGISGNKFPTPFAKPPGKGLSSSVVNVVWALFNFLIGFLLFNRENIAAYRPVTYIVFFAGIAVMSVMLAIRFQHKHKE